MRIFKRLNLRQEAQAQAERRTYHRCRYSDPLERHAQAKGAGSNEESIASSQCSTVLPSPFFDTFSSPCDARASQSMRPCSCSSPRQFRVSVMFHVRSSRCQLSRQCFATGPRQAVKSLVSFAASAGGSLQASPEKQYAKVAYDGTSRVPKRMKFGPAMTLAWKYFSARTTSACERA